MSEEELIQIFGKADCAGGQIKPLTDTEVSLSLTIAQIEILKQDFKNYKQNGGKWSWEKFLAATLTGLYEGAISGAISGATGGTIVLPGIGTISGAVALGLFGAATGAIIGASSYTVTFYVQ